MSIVECSYTGVMQFDRCYVSPNFVTDREKMSVEFDNCKVTVSLFMAYSIEVFHQMNVVMLFYNFSFASC